MTTQKTLFIIALQFLVFSGSALADWSMTVAGLSDYSFNGVSQTQNAPAIQSSLNYSFDDGGIYAGTWASNVDIGEGTNIEWDAYFGKYTQLNDALSASYGLAYYSYHGASDSSDGNYFEAYTKFGYASGLGQTELNFWYSWDYFGTGADHIVSMLVHTIELAPNHALRVSFDTSNSLDGDKYAWDGSDKSYNHYRLTYQTSLAEFDIEIAAERTSLDIDTADERILLSVKRAFDF
jgi:uncharacterized protein (TIGR02001 family)